MSNMIMILGESGTGKSTSIENLKPEETFIIQVVNKPLPFKGYKNKYPILTIKNVINDTGTTEKKYDGNRVVTDNWEKIIWSLKYVDNNKTFKNLIIDDSQYIMANEYMRRATEKNDVYGKFNEIGSHFYLILETANKLREDLNVIFLHHTEINDVGKIKAKTVGKLIDNAIGFEGLCSIVLNTEVEDGKYFFRTQNNGYDTCKSPKGMFEDLKIPNDLEYVLTKIKEYEE